MHRVTEASAGKGRRKRVLVVGQTPPPVHGQSVMIASLAGGTYKNAEISLLRMAYSGEAEEIGRFAWKKLLHLVSLICRTYYSALRLRPEVLYYPPGGSGRVGLLRDTAYLLAVRWLFSKTVFHFHAAGFEKGYSSLPRCIRPLARMAYRRPDCVIRVAEAAPDPGEILRAKQSCVVLNGIKDHFATTVIPEPEHASKPTILFLGRVCEAKGVEVLLEAASRLLASGRDFQVLLAGSTDSGEYAQYLNHKVESMDLSERVSLIGEVSGEKKHTLLLSSAIFCLPTHYEEELLPVAVIEAMSAALPVVSTRWRGIPELVEAGTSGLLVEAQDVDGLTDSLQQLLDDENLRSRMGQAGRERFLAKYTEKAYHEALDTVFGTL